MIDVLNSQRSTFQSTRPRGARQALRALIVDFFCFNPRARGGRDSWLRTSCDLGVSCFNPRARGGRDVFCHVRPLTSFLFQSTRPRGARQTPPPDLLPAAAFQSTRPRGARRMIEVLNSQRSVFQSTRPRGARLGRNMMIRSIFGFQSTRPRGARHSQFSSTMTPETVSIHAPAGGATRAGMTYGPITGVSIHAPAGGATHAGRITFQAQRVSIHAPAGGATCPVATWRSSLHRFQSTRPRGARPSNGELYTWPYSFQSTRPRGARRPA